jgi:CBS domain-containing protein
MTTTARDVMQTSVLSLAPSTPPVAVQRLFFEEEIHGAPVVDETGAVLGIVTSTDLARSAVEQSDDRVARPAAVDYLAEIVEYSPSDWTDIAGRLEGYFGDRVAADVMSKGTVSVQATTPVREVAQALSQNRIHRVLVFDGDQLCGIVSSSDLVAMLAKEG